MARKNDPIVIFSARIPRSLRDAFVESAKQKGHAIQWLTAQIIRAWLAAQKELAAK